MTKVALQGGAYMSHSVIASAQRSVNLFSEPVPEAQGEPMPAAHYPTPGLRLLSTIGPGPIRGIRQSTTGATYCVSGSGVYLVNADWTGTLLGTITAGLRTPVSMADNGIDMVIVDGTAGGWHITLVGNVFAQIDNAAGTFYGADRVDFLDTYLLFNKPQTPQFYSSDSLALTFDPLWFANKESYSDLLQTLVVVKRNIWLFGAVSTEVWANVGKPDFPFESQGDVFIDHGVVAKYSVANYDNGVFWLSRDRQGQGIVIMGAGYQTKRVSTYAIEAEIAGYERITDAIGYCYQLSGHAFYVLIFPRADKTWVYDITTDLWHEWAWIDANGDEHRHRSNCYWPINGTPVVGDWQNGNLYALDQNVYTDGGKPIKRVRSFPHIVNDGKRVFYRQFLADFDTGNLPEKLSGTVLPPATPATLEYTMETILTPDPNFPSGYTSQGLGRQTFDFGRNWFYRPISSGGVGGIAITDLTTMDVLRTVTVQQMYDGTPYGFTPGVAPSQVVYDLIAGDNSDLYMPMDDAAGGATPGQFCRFTRVNPITMKVTGEFYINNGLPPPIHNVMRDGTGSDSAVDKTATHTIVAYKTSGSMGLGPQIFDGTSMLPIGMGPTPLHSGYQVRITAGARYPDGSCDFIMTDPDWQNPATGNINIWRINVSNGLAITSTMTGTLNVLTTYPAPTGLFVVQADYDPVNDCLVMQVTSSSGGSGPPIAVMSVDYDGTANWVRAFPTQQGITYGKNQSLLTGGTLMVGDSNNLTLLNTTTGAIIFAGGIEVMGIAAGSLWRIWDSVRNAYWTYATSRGSVRIDFVAAVPAPPPVPAEDRLISLEWSDDRGHSFGSPVSQAIGNAGEYRTSLQWQRCGMSRDRVWRLSWSVPMATALQGCWFDATPAQS